MLQRTFAAMIPACVAYALNGFRRERAELHSVDTAKKGSTQLTSSLSVFTILQAEPLRAVVIDRIYIDETERTKWLPDAEWLSVDAP